MLDKRKGVDMKKGIISVVSALTGVAAGAAAGVFLTGRTLGETAAKEQKMSNKHLALFLMMNQWVLVKQEGKNLASYFEKNNYRKIAVYGMSYAGERLLNELKGSDIEVAYGIDQNADGIYADIKIVTKEDALEPVDAIVVTPVFFFQEIEKDLAGKVDCPILSLEDILYEV